MIVYGHRGAKGEAPENTLPGFEYAYGLGVRAFELDVRLTVDNQIVVLHDATVDRTTNGTGPISQMTLATAQSLDARGAFPDWPEPCRIPTFVELLDFLPGDVRLEVEIKRDEPARLEMLCPLLVAQIASQGYVNRVMVSSFDATALRIMRTVAPDLPRAFIGKCASRADLETAFALGCAQADIPLATGSRDLVNEAHAHGLTVTGWPGNDASQLETLIDWQVEHVTSDLPHFVLPFLRERGLLSTVTIV